MRGKKLEFTLTPSNCIVTTSHKLNADGYLRIRDFRYEGAGRKPLIMAHRLFWEIRNGDIPAGFEVDHICRNRACCNPEHLQVLSVKEHKVKTNCERYAERKEKAKTYWENYQCTGTELSQKFGVTPSAACRWIRGWKV